MKDLLVTDGMNVYSMTFKQVDMSMNKITATQDFRVLCYPHGNTGCYMLSQGDIAVVSILPFIKINANWAIDEDGCTTPKFEDSGGISIIKKWSPPDTKMLFISIAETKRHFIYLYSHIEPEKIFRLPTSNVYDSGRLCTGAGLTNINIMSKKGIGMRHEKLIQQWNKNRFQGDMHGLYPNAHHLIRFNPDGSQNNDKFSVSKLSEAVQPMMTVYEINRILEDLC